jgi:hypothetical protein
MAGGGYIVAEGDPQAAATVFWLGHQCLDDDDTRKSVRGSRFGHARDWAP